MIRPLAFAAALAVLAPAAQAQTQTSAPAPAPAAPAADAGADFMVKVAKEPGVKVLPSGLAYKVVKAGDEKSGSPKEGDVIKVHYEGSTSTGQVFDSTFQRQRPSLMQLYGLVPAWMEALPLMHTGDEWVLYVPPSLGYGSRGAGPIPPNSTLVFRLQLLGFLSAD